MKKTTHPIQASESEILARIEQRSNRKKLSSLKESVSVTLSEIPQKVPDHAEIPEWDRLPISKDASSVEKMRVFKKSRLASGETISELCDEGKR